MPARATQFDLPFSDVHCPPNTTTAVFIPAGSWRNTELWTKGRSGSEMRVRYGGITAQPTLQFARTEDSTPVNVGIGQTAQANQVYFPDTNTTDITSRSAEYPLVRPGWLVTNSDAAGIGIARVGGYIAVSD